MAGTSNLTPDALQYLYASNTNVSNFVTVKLSGNDDYPLWKAQMLCLMESFNMCGIVDDTFAVRKVLSKDIMKQYDSLLKGWIFGSISKNVLGNVFKLNSAKDVWDKLISVYDPTLELEQDSAPAKSEGETDIKEKDIISAETDTKEKDVITEETEGDSAPTKSEGETDIKEKDIISAETDTNEKDVITEETEGGNKDTNSIDILVEGQQSTEGRKLAIRGWRVIRRDIVTCSLHEATIQGNWAKANKISEHCHLPLTDATNIDGQTLLHVAIANGQNDFIKNLLTFVDDETFFETRDSAGNTALHVAAAQGNTETTKLLVKKNKNLLQILNHNGEGPLQKSYENLHFDTFEYLLQAGNDGSRPFPSFVSGQPGDEYGIGLLINAISAKRYTLAYNLIRQNNELSRKSDDVLMAIATTFPPELDYWETLIYPTWTLINHNSVGYQIKSYLVDEFASCSCNDVNLRVSTILQVPVMTFSVTYKSICFLIWVVQLLSIPIYFYLWNIATRLVSPIKNIEKKRNELREARKVLRLVSGCIFRLGDGYSYHPYLTRPLLEAARQDAPEVIKQVLTRTRKGVTCTDENGHDIIQLAVLHRSQNVYNLIHDHRFDKNAYRTKVDSCENNILHLAGRLAPSSKLNHITGAALQVQRELQWCEEIKNLVFPAFLTKANNNRETPDMVFTKEHKSLVKEGENWMKGTAESCSITAALITTIVFAAAITVPGGTNQDTGIPVFTEDVAFIIFALSDAISLFTSTTSLLVFLSILTARFSEKDFLVKLPRRLIIGLSTLLISTISMIIAFGATLFLVFCHKKLWMLAPICLLALLPIWFFVTLQFPLIVDLFLSTHVSIFRKKRDVL